MDHRPRARLALVSGVVFVLAGCPSPPGVRPARFVTRDVGAHEVPAEYIRRELTLSPVEVSALDPSLRAHLRAHPHAYYRFVGHRFIALSCGIASEGPTVNLHGDAHLQQYLVTSRGRGLGDFDEATLGPVGIDFLRLATSIQIVSRMRGWDAAELYQRFLEGYVAALDDPELRVEEPLYAREVRASFRRSHVDLLAETEALMEPVDEREAAEVEVAFLDYLEMLGRHDPSFDRRSFEVVRIARHSLGVGSRRTTNFLIRTRGASDDPDDDRLLEAKQVRGNRDAWCLPAGRTPDALRIIVADQRLSYAPFLNLGYFTMGGDPYWVHEWVDDYIELAVRDPHLDHERVAGVLYDAGVQLGEGHPRGLSTPFEAELRRSLAEFVGNRAASLFEVSATFADAVWAVWERFVEGT